MQHRIRVIQGDITSLNVDAIVNAANRTLLGGGGVDGAIHRAAGPELVEACRLLNGCSTGDAKITPGFRLMAKFVIHTVGPVWNGGVRNEKDLLASCYRKSLELATQNNCNSIAFPNISTGIYRFPKQPAAEIAIETANEYLRDHALPDTVLFVCFDEENLRIYREEIKKISA